MSIAGRAIIKVQCHSGYTYAERPTGFICRHEDYKVEEVEWQQREPQGVHFGVITKK